jgi:zinc D-Ala-D-Ala carboxypeptidase
MKRIHILIVALAVLFIAAVSGFVYKNNKGKMNTIVSKEKPALGVQTKPVQQKNLTTGEAPKPESPPLVGQQPPTTVDKQKTSNIYSLEESSSLALVVNKKHRLPSDYEPGLSAVRGGYLREEAASGLQALLGAAESAGHGTKLISGYRSYSKQSSVYQGYVAQYGQEYADTISARPGHSEHQTGLAADIGNADGYCDLEICFGTTSLGQWLAAHAHEYGFIVRYPEAKESLTGYQYEPWHLRYVGTETASKVFNSAQTLDQFMGVEAGGY